VRLLTLVSLAGVALLGSARALEPTPQELFERRILPIFKSPNPSSCVRCHLAGVDLKNYILPSHEKTFVSLRDQGLIDLDRPAKSKILDLIQMGADDRKAASLIHAKTRQAEYDAFAAWVTASAEDPKLRTAPKLDAAERAGPAKPAEVVRHGRKDRLLESFERDVWAWRFRCMNCHTEGTPQNEKHRKEHGERVAWVKTAGAEATMEFLLAGKIIDPRAPDKSLLLQKPLGTVEHGGGVKFAPGDQAYKGFRAWIEDVAAIRGVRYARAEDLPPAGSPPARFGTEVWLKLTNTPPAWADKYLQVDVFAWDARAKAWEKEPVATSDRLVFGKGRLWQHTLTLLAAPGSERAKTWRTAKPSLPRGKYLVRVSVDRGGRLGADWRATLGDADRVGEAEVESAWPEGYGRMTPVDAGRVKP
jgi:hypothetical protein